MKADEIALAGHKALYDFKLVTAEAGSGINGVKGRMYFEQEELDALRPDLSGEEIMELLDLKPGPDVGKARNFLMELRLEEGALGPEEAKSRLLQWWQAR